MIWTLAVIAGFTIALFSGLLVRISEDGEEYQIARYFS